MESMTLLVGWHENLLCGSKVGGVDWVCLVHDRNEWSCPAEGLITLQALLKMEFFDYWTCITFRRRRVVVVFDC